MVNWELVAIIIAFVILAPILTMIIFGIKAVKDPKFRRVSNNLIRPDVWSARWLRVTSWNDIVFDEHVRDKRNFDAGEKKKKNPL
ncbi:hypothetical protein BD31_I1508 [Candidatus Nitrosopumilus salaria BD31]|uniref:Uncharacterized protein n=1 Tax=Candidatus Nitrosopumilus salarius BD31 TaxID=859350 RepID=I3D3P4_9ARCH|nr:hypothetical protein [Candidatus Nitrosopumilus salaria]EIJ66337.1 hypothetical protein BD31_I1508 [Candidatus Nitrosopumilus salaria BD31]